MVKKGQGGGMPELVYGHGKLIFAFFTVVLMFLLLYSIVSSHPEWGITLPPLFGG
jgi:hypothetical protein